MNDTAARRDADIGLLFQPLQVGRLRLKNRIVMAPMTRSFSPDGVPPPAVADYYRRRAEGEVGLIVTEGTAIERPSAKNDPGVPHIYGAEALAGWARVVAAVHEAGGQIASQLWHVGPRLDPTITHWTAPEPVDSAAGLRHHEGERLAAMDDAAIADTLAAYTRATENAVAIGFDTVEIHGAHGYLIDDFFWHVSNTRDDEWGGATLRERTRFAVEVVRAVKSALPADMPLIFRLSQWKGLDFEARVAHTPAEMEQWFEPLAEAGVDIFHCSQRRFWEPAIAGSHLNLAGWAKRVTGKVAITVGSVGLSGEFIAGGHSTPVSIDGLLDRMSHGEFDLVAVGRALLADPEWIVKIREGRTDALKPYDPSLKKVLY